MKKKRKFLSILLILAMCLQLLPVTAFAETSESISNPYLSDFTFKYDDTHSVDMLSKGEIVPFVFDPAQSTYDIVLVDDPKSKSSAQIIATLFEKYIDSNTKYAGMWFKGTAYRNGSGLFFDNGSYTLNKIGTPLSLANHKPTSDLVTLQYKVGKPEGDFTTLSQNTVLNEAATYTFNFYVKEALNVRKFEAAYENGEKITPDSFDVYSTNITLRNVSFGTPSQASVVSELTLDENDSENNGVYTLSDDVRILADAQIIKITAPAVTTKDAVLKFDNGSGTYEKGDSNTTYSLDLAKYEDEKYQKAEGYYVIPFKLEYVGNTTAGVDGHYTLTVIMEGAQEPEINYTPKITDLIDKTAKVGEEVSLEVVVEPMDDDKANSLTYQWYSASSKEDKTGEQIENATERIYIPSTENEGTFYYFCEVTRKKDGVDYPCKSNTVQVTVQKASDEPSNSYIKNISITNLKDNFAVFNTFDSATKTYDVVLPYFFSCTMPIELSDLAIENKDNLQLVRWLEDANGNIVVPEKKISFYNLDLFSDAAGEFLNGSIKPIFYNRAPGQYALKVKIYEIDDGKQEKPGTAEEYTFNITISPRVYKLIVTADGKDLSVQPPVDFNLYENTFYAEDYFVTAPSDTQTISLAGNLLPYTGAKFIFNEADNTESFQNTNADGGVKVELAKCSQNENGAYLVPFTIAFGDEQTNYTLHIEKTTGGSWKITKHPQGGTFEKGANAVLTVNTDATNASDIVYQWQYTRTKNPTSTTKFVDIPGANSATYNAPTNNGGLYATRNYRCAITDKTIGAVEYSNPALVEVNLGKVNAPEITYQPGKYSFDGASSPNGAYKNTYFVGEKVEALQAVVAGLEGDSTIDATMPVRIEVQWYYNTKPSTDGATKVDGTSNGFTNNYARFWQCAVPNTLAVGEHYYYFVATAVSVEDETNRNSVTSDFAKITIVGREGLAGFDGKGTNEDPYIIRTVDDFKKIDEYVLSGNFLSGAVFKMANDIELPLDWEPIGENKGGSGKNLLPFSGTIDGDGHKLTVAEGGRPLLEFCRDAVVRNLDIYGKKINGAGLLEKGSIDYGTDGIYQELTDPDVITLENVKLLSGSQTKDAGLVFGGVTSGINDVIIKNCVIEPGVIVGYDKQQDRIGSFVGQLNGRIENSVSYAEVYGKNIVGGLAANKGQSMGACEIVNSAFLGKIVATGNQVGGILATGYISGSAPSTPPVTIRNCYVVANITANSAPVTNYKDRRGIGGILGSEIGATALKNKGAIQDNHFYGTITDTNPDEATRYKRVGGILGEAGNYDTDKLVYANNYYLTNSNYTGLGYQRIINDSWKPDTESFIAKTAEEFANGDVLKLLNEGEFKNWTQDAKYPVVDLSKVVPVSLTMSGEYKNTYYIGDELDLSGAVFTLNMSDGSKQTLKWTEVEITGYDKNTRAVQKLTATYGAVSVEFEVTVLKKPVQDDPNRPNVPGVDPNKIRVYFTLMGDTAHGAPTGDKDTHTLSKRNLQTWIARRAVEVDLNARVVDVFEQALTEVGMTWRNPSGNYIEAITNNGQTLAEFSNGNLSGWMYLLNGERSLLGVSEQFLENGDNIIFHYTDDWTVEKGSDNLSGSGGGNKGGAVGTGINAGSIVLQPGTFLNGDGQNEANVTTNEINKAVEGAKNDKLTNIVIEPNVKGNEPSILLKVALDGAKAIAEANMSLTVNTNKGSVAMGEAALKSITSQAGGIDIRFIIEAKNTKTDEVKNDATNALQQAAANFRGTVESLFGNASVTEVTILSNNKAITSFGGNELTLYLPVANRDQYIENENYKVIAISADGTVETLIGKCMKYNGQVVVRVKVNHLSTFIVTNETEKEIVEQPKTEFNFADVNESQWFYEAVKFVFEAGLMNGESANEFKPNGNLNRAMLVTILYRLEEQPEVSENSKFSDVPSGQWYSEAVIWASANGIVNGYEDNTFKPMNNVSREEMAAMLMRYAEYKGIDVSATKDISSYNDAAKVANWAKQNMAWANSAGLIQGDENNNLNPQGKATRAEAAMILMRLVKNVIG